MTVALLGTRGIPANYGGFETFAAELAARLVKRGHRVTVYCRAHHASGQRTWRGARLLVLPTLRGKYTDTAAHTLLSSLHLLLRGADVALYCNGANAVFTFWPRLAGIPTVLNVDGLERKRRKWNGLARTWYALSERWSTLCPSRVVTDALTVRTYYRERYGLNSEFIAYGAPTGPARTSKKLAELGLERGRYYLYVSRFEPENNALLVVREFERSSTQRRLVMVGDAPYAASYIRQVRATRDARILFTGAIYGDGYAELQSHCHAYVHATEVGGTHPALVEAMGRGCAVLYLDTPENREVAGRAGLSFTTGEGGLAARIEELEAAGSERLHALRRTAAGEASERYDWEAVTDEYEHLLQSLVARGKA